jgi:hypothetical protein
MVFVQKSREGKSEGMPILMLVVLCPGCVKVNDGNHWNLAKICSVVHPLCWSLSSYWEIQNHLHGWLYVWDGLFPLLVRQSSERSTVVRFSYDNLTHSLSSAYPFLCRPVFFHSNVIVYCWITSDSVICQRAGTTCFFHSSWLQQ